MAYEASQPLKITLEAAADLSAQQYRFVTLDANGRAAVTTATTDKVIGVLQNKPSALGQTAEIVVIGVTKMSADAAIAIADGLATSVDGQAAVDNTGTARGYALTAAGAAGVVFTAIVNCVNPGL